jgi:hypothetical protein
MKHLKPFISITEAITLPDARKATEIFLSSGGKERYNEIFKGKDRLYYYMDDDFEKRYIYNPLEKSVSVALNNSGYRIIDYTKGLASKDGDNKNVFKIQKILNKIGELDLRNKMDADPLRFSSTKKDKMIVISRHGIDIAGQSTGRDWTSCKSITIEKTGMPQGINGRYVWTEIEQGSLVAYLITPEDVNIEKPIARIIIGVYINEKDPNDFILYPDSSVYGNYKMSDFSGFVKKWCIDLNRKLSPKTDGIYNISDKCYVDHVMKINVMDNPFSNIKSYLGAAGYGNMVNITKRELIADDIKDIFKYIEDQESDLKQTDVFDLFDKIKKNTNHIDYAGFINGNSYNEIKKYLDKYPDFFLSYISSLNYDSISDKDKENKIRNAIKSHFEKTDGPDYIDGFRYLVDIDSPDIPLDFIKWILIENK